MPDRQLTLMAVHAHPDDEASGTGGVLALYASQGIRTVLVTCTDGRCGDGPGGVKPGEPGHDPAAVVATRLAELNASCAILNVSDLELLGYADSGMAGWPQNHEPGAFVSVPVAESAGKLAELIRRYQPDVVVTYDANGFYGHPDHIQAHLITMAAVAETNIPAKLYWTTESHSKMAEFMELIRQFHPDGDQLDAEQGDDAVSMGLPDDEIQTWIDTAAFASQKFDALAAHASQGDNTFFTGLGREKFAEFMGVEAFVRVQDRTGSELPEDDLFAGLRD